MSALSFNISVQMMSNGANNPRVYLDRKLKLWKSGPSSLRSWSSVSWRRRAVWRRGRRLRARSSYKSELSITAAWPRGRWGRQKTRVCVCVCKTLIINVRLYETGHVGSQEKMGTLEAQVKQLGLQAAQECERMVKDRTLILQLLQKVSTSAYPGGIYLKVAEEVCRSFTTENVLKC